MLPVVCPQAAIGPVVSSTRTWGCVMELWTVQGRPPPAPVGRSLWRRRPPPAGRRPAARDAGGTVRRRRHAGGQAGGEQFRRGGSQVGPGGRQRLVHHHLVAPHLDREAVAVAGLVVDADVELVHGVPMVACLPLPLASQRDRRSARAAGPVSDGPSCPESRPGRRRWILGRAGAAADAGRHADLVGGSGRRPAALPAAPADRPGGSGPPVPRYRSRCVLAWPQATTRARAR
jgi:hypothetical protein